MSDINYLSINENFPVAGQDNDTQVFRDNFDTIKNSLRISKEEITDIENNGARLDQSNDYNSNVTQRTVLLNTSVSSLAERSPEASTIEIDFTAAAYHIIKIAGEDKTLEFTNFPGDAAATDTVSTGAGTATVELYGDGGGAKNSGNFIVGRQYRITEQNDTDFTTLGASDNNVGTVFTATATGAGNGTGEGETPGIANEYRRLSFIATGNADIKTDENFPTNIDLISTTDPIIIEVRRHPHKPVVFIKYVGLFS